MEMTSESKTEPNKKKQKAEAKQELEENPEPLKYKTCVLKVSIHCEGCKRKVKKILMNLEGVYTVDIDWKQQKVTVTGNVNAGILIKKLLKAGKHADMFPEKPDSKEKKQSKPKNKEKNKEEIKQSEEATSNSRNGGCCGGDKGKKDKGKAKIAQNSGCSSGEGLTCAEGVRRNAAAGENGGKKDKGGEDIESVGEDCARGEGDGQVKETKSDVKQSVTSSAGGKSPSAADDKKSGGGGVATVKKSEDGGSGDKKKTKGEKLNNSENAKEGVHPIDAPENSGSLLPSFPAPYSANQDPPHNQGYSDAVGPTSHSPPRQDAYPYGPNYYSPQQRYGVSYSITNSSTGVYGASYYTSPPPYSYSFMHQGSESEPLPSDPNLCPSRPSDTFELFSDENPNACSLM